MTPLGPLMFVETTPLRNTTDFFDTILPVSRPCSHIPRGNTRHATPLPTDTSLCAHFWHRHHGIREQRAQGVFQKANGTLCPQISQTQPRERESRAQVPSGPSKSTAPPGALCSHIHFLLYPTFPIRAKQNHRPAKTAPSGGPKMSKTPVPTNPVFASTISQLNFRADPGPVRMGFHFAEFFFPVVPEL
jgi:hypothetical protein